MVHFPFINPRKTYQERIKDDLDEAQEDLLRAEKSLEYWQAMTDMLRHRVQRLNNQHKALP
jgi:F0F1-type ATP synthase membrane subunit b/b'